MSRTEALPPAIESVVFDAAEIGRTVARLAAAIASENVGEPITLLGVLKGALFFTAELDVRIDTIAVASYGDAKQSSGEVRLLKDASESVEGKHILVVEDIVDEGLTLTYLLRLLAGRRPASLRTCVLLNKPYRRRVQIRVDHVGLTAPDSFVVGYGLDYQEKYRNLPYLARLRDDVIGGLRRE